MKKNISYKLFKVYVIFFTAFISILLITFGLYVGVDMNNNIIDTQEQMVHSINKNIDNIFEDMNEFSIALKDSKIFKNIAITNLPETYESNGNLSSYFRDMYLSAYKMIEKSYKVGIYVYDGYYIWLGNNYFINKTQVDSSTYYQDYANYGYKNINYVKNNPFLEEFFKSHKSKGIVNEDTISLSRTINEKNIFNRPEAMLEVHIPYIKLEELMNDIIATKDTKDMKILLYDIKGNAIYGKDEFDIADFMSDGKINQGKYKQNKNIISILPVESSNIYMVSIVKSSRLYSSLKKYILFAVVIFLIVNIILIVLTYKIAIRITTPLKNICSQIENIDLRQRSSYQYNLIQTDIHEIDILNTTINNMQKKLVDSLDKIVSLESFEVQSKMLALQSQMQPHFLYNTLMTISALAENNENDKVSRVCFALTHMLRYISSNNTNSVTIADEMQYVDKYMDIMEERFEDICIDWNISLDMIDILVPKLIIQPLVENSLKYNEKCNIRIDGFVTDDIWTIRVIDDGIGFSDGTIDNIMMRCEKVSKNYKSYSLQIDGMGILNIYIRLKLLYEDNMSFNIGNIKNGGCFVEIGGQVERFNDERDI
ncbi:hypothetical protein SH1V18_00790 [Vallitalea longa]|uniref:Signal transduction histidine kinase internal region domain-containing protein n=1 Tax=Vallitalea longa TaxID=2936439 RepID=A0A9W5Y7J8_9FIRM|nr:histidine kinase [Vallitalea longa]GKX27599.1 hypothetical protein SH1V18_00790 [Vallitalea longa]